MRVRDRVGEGAVAVRIVRLDHGVVEPDVGEVPGTERIVDEAPVNVTAEELTGTVGNARRPIRERSSVRVEPERPLQGVGDVVGPLRDEGNPADTALGETDLEGGIAIELAAEEPVRDRERQVQR